MYSSFILYIIYWEPFLNIELKSKKKSNTTHSSKTETKSTITKTEEPKPTETKKRTNPKKKPKSNSKTKKEEVSPKSSDTPSTESKTSPSLSKNKMGITHKKLNKTETQKIQNLLKGNKIKCFYHFTDQENLDSIKAEGGLYSWYALEENNIQVAHYGGDDLSRKLDRRYKLEDYVRLSFCKQHPMKYSAKIKGQINKPVLLEISTEVAFFEDTLFSDMNATKNEHSCQKGYEGLESVKFDIVKQRNHFNLTEEQRPYYQAEILVKRFIPIEFIKNIDKLCSTSTTTNGKKVTAKAVKSIKKPANVTVSEVLDDELNFIAYPFSKVKEDYGFKMLSDLPYRYLISKNGKAFTFLTQVQYLENGEREDTGKEDYLLLSEKILNTIANKESKTLQRGWHKEGEFWKAKNVDGETAFIVFGSKNRYYDNINEEDEL